MFNLLGGCTVTFTGSVSNQTVSVNAGPVTFQSSGGAQTYNLTSGTSPVTIVGSTLNLGAASSPLNMNLYSATGTPYLTVGIGGALNVYYGSHVSAQNLSMAQGSGTSTIMVDAIGSTGSYLNCSGAALISGSGGTGNITFQNSATGAFAGAIAMLADANAADSANFTVQSGASVTTSTLNLATSGAAGQAAMTVTGGSSSIVQTGAASLTVGSATGGTATLNVNSGGTFSSATGLATVNKTGMISVNGGTCNFNGNLTINGGVVASSDSGALNWSGTAMTITNSGRLSYGNANTTINVNLPASATVTGAGSRLETPGYLNVGSQLSITAGGRVAPGMIFLGGGQPSTLLVDGLNSQLVCSPVGTTCSWGIAGWNATATFSNSATGSFPDNGISLAGDGSPNTVGTVIVESGAHLDTWTLTLNRYGGSGSSATLTVTGAGSQATASYMTRIGNDSTGLGVLTVSNGGSYTSANTELRAMGQVNVSGGAVNLGMLSQLGGHVYFSRGALTYTGDLTVGPGGLFGDYDVSLSVGQSVTLSGTTTVDPYTLLSLNGGTLSTGSLVNHGMIEFTKGTLAITSADLAIDPIGPFGSTLTLGTGQNLSATTATISPGAILELQSGASFTAGSLVNSGELVLNGLTATAGGGSVENAGLIHGQGRITAVVDNNAGGEIRAEAGQRVNLQGASGSNQGLISLQGGTLEFSQPLTNTHTGLIAGRGTFIVDSSGLLSNEGSVWFSAGLTDIYATVNNAAGASIVTSGGGTTTFYEGLSNAGEIRTSPGCTSAFFGTVTLSGTGKFTGSGIMDFEGVHPGSGLALLSIASGSSLVSAQVLLGSDTTIDTTGGDLVISGSITGSRQLTKTGSGVLTLSNNNTYTGGTNVLAGELIVSNNGALLNGTSLTVGVNAASIFGAAARPTVTSLAVSPVPEPRTLVLLLAGCVVGLGCWQRKR